MEQAKEKIEAVYATIMFWIWWAVEMADEKVREASRKNKKIYRMRRLMKRKIRSWKAWIKGKLSGEKPHSRRSSNKYQQSSSFITDTIMTASSDDESSQIITSRDYLANLSKDPKDTPPEPYYQLMQDGEL